MTIALSFYAKVINNICMTYCGLAPEYAVQMDYVRQVIKKTYPELSISISLSDGLLYLVPDSLPIKDLDRSKFAYIKEFNFDASIHPILNFIRDSALKFEPLPPVNQGNKFCLVCPQAVHPSKPLDDRQLEKAYDLAKSRGYCPVVMGIDVEVDGEGKVGAVEQAGCVIGAENEYVFLAAVRGIKSVLVPTGQGTELYKAMFPNGEVYERI